MTSLVERHAAKIVGTLSCYDRVIIQGTLPGVGYAAGMTGYLKARGVRIFDFAEFTKPLTQAIRENVQRIASQHGLEVEYIRSAKLLRKEDRIAEVLAKRGNHPGLVHIFSAMETCSTFAPWHDKKTGKTSLRRDSGKCIHYYFYFLDPELGLCYVRVPTWAPFRLQVYFNGHNWLAHRLEERGSQFTLADNAFLSVDDFAAAQKLSDGFDVKPLHKALDRFAAAFCPVAREFRCSFQGSLMQVEYATDIVFKSRDDLKDVYPAIIRTALHAAKVDDVMGFLGRKHPPPIAARSAPTSRHASGEPGSSTAWGHPRSRSTTSSDASCASRRPPTTSPSSSTTVKLSKKMARSGSSSRRRDYNANGTFPTIKMTSACHRQPESVSRDRGRDHRLGVRRRD
jgi:hypothetical protein